MALCLAPLLLAAGTVPPESAAPAKEEVCKVEPRAARPEATHFYSADADARAAVDAALADAAKGQKVALIVFGADWCHDSRALARVLTGDAFKSEFADRFAVTFIDVGKPQTGEGRNLDQIARFGVKRLKSTPAMIAAGPTGKAINSKKDALSWRNADSRSEAAVLAWLRGLKTSK